MTDGGSPGPEVAVRPRVGVSSCLLGEQTYLKPFPAALRLRHSL